MNVVFLIGGLILLVAGGEFLVRSSVGLSLKLNLSRMIVGLTVVSFATSAPELIVSIQSALNGLSGLAVGNVIGSNIANIALVLGVTAIIGPMAIDKDFFKFNWPWMMAFSLLLMALLFTNKDINRLEGALLVSSIAVFVVLLIKRARKKNNEIELEEGGADLSWARISIFLVLGGLALWQGSELLVSGAVGIANALEIPESVIAVSMVAVGTSVPELAASIIAAIKKEKAISLGNLIGSNIFNIGSVLGITALIQPIEISSSNEGLLTNDLYWMLGIALALLPLAYLPSRYEIGRLKGGVYVGAYALYLYLAFNTL